MKKLLLFFAVVTIAMTGCQEKICGTSDYKIVNQIESDIVIELKFGARQETIIHSGETRMIYHSEWCRDTRFEPAMTPEILNAEMTIDGELIPRTIWRHEYWTVNADFENDYSIFSLTVTDELLETITNLKD